MFETLFGSEMPLAARFFIAFLVVLALIGLTAWLVRRFGANRLGSGARGRQPRLAVIDAATVDGRRRLVLIRRDNIEHLLMIGGPTDLVVEPNIVRAAGARDVAREPARVVPAMETPAPTARQAPPVVENGWPLQPLNEPAPVPAPRSYRSNVTEEPWLAPEPGARPRPVENFEPPPRKTQPEPRVAPAAPPEPSAPPQTDHNLAEMAQQLEAALRRAPMPEGRPPVTDPLAAPPVKSVEPPARPPMREFKPRVEPKFEPKAFEPKPFEPKPFESKSFETKHFEPKADVKAEPKLDLTPEPAAEPKVEPKLDKPAAPGKTVYDDLEEEMASLLGRPTGKT